MNKVAMITAASLALTTFTANAADLKVKVLGVASDDGTVRVSVHDGAEGFPSDRKFLLGQAVPAKAGGVTVVFADLQPGKYAVVGFHDIDGDEELATNLVGMPAEPYGFSRDARGSFGPPEFDAAAFEVGDADQTIQMTLTE